MEIYLVTIDTEDGETYQYVYGYQPSIREYKKKFFDEHKIYRRNDWDDCIGHKVDEFDLILKS